jgi:outer membrane protein OmpA-like peptidoglycan-associated protein
LLNSLTDLFKSQVSRQASARLGESENSVIRGFEATVATIVAGLASKGTQAGFKQQIYEMITSPQNDPRILEDPGALAGAIGNGAREGLGSQLLSLVFGGQQGGVAELIARSSGLRSGSAAQLMNVAAPMLLAFLGKQVRDNRLDASGLWSMLQREASAAMDKLPAGVGSLLGLPAAIRPETVHPSTTRTDAGRWVTPLLICLALLGGLFWLMNRSRQQTAERQAPTTGERSRYQAETMGLVVRQLPNGVELRIPGGGFEERVLAVVSNPSRPVDPNEWIDFDRVTFQPGSATLNPESREQLSNEAKILKAYPNTHVKIGGYTDNTGDADANQRLSQARAESVRRELIALGVPADRIEAEGYGPQYPAADNATEEGRAKNRRISMRVTQK